MKTTMKILKAFIFVILITMIALMIISLFKNGVVAIISLLTGIIKNTLILLIIAIALILFIAIEFNLIEKWSKKHEEREE